MHDLGPGANDHLPPNERNHKEENEGSRRSVGLDGAFLDAKLDTWNFKTLRLELDRRPAEALKKDVGCKHGKDAEQEEDENCDDRARSVTEPNY